MNTVAIVGRPNVGKSALFNRLVGRRIAIVDSTYGFTRDRISVRVTRGEKSFSLVDTGGIDFDVSDDIRARVKMQSEFAVSEADTVLLVTDVQQGLVPLDEVIAGLLREAGRSVIVVANKADNDTLDLAASEFHRLGFPSVFAVSALHGRGIADLVEHITGSLQEEGAAAPDRALKIAVVGRPNVGKSSYVNAVLREERLIVHDAPGTTRDSIDTRAEWRGRGLTLIDTAGMRRRRTVSEPADYFGVARSRESLRRCDISLIMIDAAEGVRNADEKIARMALDLGKGCVLAVNKWDLVRKKNTRAFREEVWRKMPFFNFVPLVFISATHRRGIDQSLRTLFYVHEQTRKRIATPILTRALRALWERNMPPVRKNKRPKLYYATQPAVEPPRILLFVNNKSLIHRTYINYLSNGLRKAFGFEGAPLFLALRNRN